MNNQNTNDLFTDRGLNSAELWLWGYQGPAGDGGGGWVSTPGISGSVYTYPPPTNEGSIENDILFSCKIAYDEVLMGIFGATLYVLNFSEGT